VDHKVHRLHPWTLTVLPKDCRWDSLTYLQAIPESIAGTDRQPAGTQTTLRIVQQLAQIGHLFSIDRHQHIVGVQFRPERPNHRRPGRRVPNDICHFHTEIPDRRFRLVGRDDLGRGEPDGA